MTTDMEDGFLSSQVYVLAGGCAKDFDSDPQLGAFYILQRSFEFNKLPKPEETGLHCGNFW